MNTLCTLLSGCFPSTWGINGYIHMKSNGAELWQVAHPYGMLWLLTAAYFLLAYIIYRYTPAKHH